MSKGLLFVISGPSAAGKGTICKNIIKEMDIDLSISMTTRKPRPNEVDVKSYFFVTQEEYDEVKNRGGFLE